MRCNTRVSPAATKLAGIVLALFALPPLAAQRLADKELAVTELADGVHAAVWTDALGDPIEGNALFIINDDDVVVVDAALFPSSARRMIAELEKLTDKPVRYLVNTHWHDDHHGGNLAYRERWPEVAIVAHTATRANILEHTYKPRPGILAEYEQSAAKYARWVETGRDDDGQPLEQGRRQRASDLVALFRTAVEELRAAGEMPPDLTFTDRLVLRRGARTIEVR
jgi:glyoxylase-like metal-dependent hydrolase (beta-lactamase superfamily II)